MPIFACLEGIDASGKGTQAKRLATRLDAALFSFPDYVRPMGQIIQAHLHSAWRAACLPASKTLMSEDSRRALDPMVFQAVQLANRLEAAPAIADAIARRYVVADRYSMSALAYGGVEGLDWRYLWEVQQHLPQPDLFILLDVNVKQSVERRPDRRDRYESRLDFMEEVAENYRDLFHKFPAFMDLDASMFVTVDGRGSKDEVEQDILAAVFARERELEAKQERES